MLFFTHVLSSLTHWEETKAFNFELKDLDISMCSTDIESESLILKSKVKKGKKELLFDKQKRVFLRNLFVKLSKLPHFLKFWRIL